ncbi:MAG: chromosome partitioning protein ParB, partial [Paracoccaceae bacterium]|nr:chromosome partitioning protein ParB [Paracoccaceae bacterium]
MAGKKETKRGLGRGLSALMADVDPKAVQRGSETDSTSDRSLPIEQIEPNPDQPRRTFT